MKLDTAGCANITEAARVIGVHPNTIRNWAHLGLMKFERLPFSGYLRIPEAEVRRLALVQRQRLQEQINVIEEELG